jgi:uroporphyrinogen III methyltransferase/synthase
MVQKAPNLKGKVIAITRAEGQAEETASLIERMGGKPYIIPTMEFKMPEDLSQIRDFIEDLQHGKADYTVFMSVNAVRFLLKEAEVLGLTRHLYSGLGKTRIIAVGPRTAEELMRHNIHVDLIPEKYSSNGVAQALVEIGLRGKSVFIPRAKGASPTLREKLESLGARVREIHVYEQQIPINYEKAKAFIEHLTSGRIDAIVFGSSQSVKNFLQLIGTSLNLSALRETLNRPLIVAIGPETAKTLRDNGLKVDVIPEVYTFQEALAALARHFKQNRSEGYAVV